MPVIDGARIFAGENSKAELEFEDGSSVRLAGPAQIALIELSFSAGGSPITSSTSIPERSTSMRGFKDHADFRISLPTGESLDVTKPSRLRFTVDEQVASLAVTDGEADIPEARR